MSTIVEGGLDDPRIVALLEAHLALMQSISPPESTHALDLLGLKSPEVRFWGVWEGDALLGVGALKAFDGNHGEIKSMHTYKEQRGRGTGALIVTHIIDEARKHGLKRLSLETGSMAEFAPAHRLYLRHGFAPCEPFGEYRVDPNSVFMTRLL